MEEGGALNENTNGSDLQSPLFFLPTNSQIEETQKLW